MQIQVLHRIYATVPHNTGACTIQRLAKLEVLSQWGLNVSLSIYPVFIKTEARLKTFHNSF